MDIVGLLRDSEVCAARNRFRAIDEIERLRGLVSVSGVLCDDCGEPAISVSDDTARCKNCLAAREGKR